MSTCRWLQETEQQVVKLIISDTRQNPDGDQKVPFEAYIMRLPGDQLGFYLDQAQDDRWEAWVLWEIEGGPFNGDLIIEVINPGLNEEGLPYVDEMTGLRYWQVKVDEPEIVYGPIESMPVVDEADIAWDLIKRVGGTTSGDKLHEAEVREHRHSGDDPEHPPFTDEEGKFDPGD